MCAGGMPRVTSNDAARLVTAIIALWDEITWRYQLLIEHRSSSVVFSSPVPDDYKQLVAFGYGIGVSVGQIHKAIWRLGRRGGDEGRW